MCLSVVARPQLVRGRARTPRSGQASCVWLQGHSQAPDSEQACPGVRLGQTLASPAWSAAPGACHAPPRARGSSAARVRGASRARGHCRVRVSAPELPPARGDDSAARGSAGFRRSPAAVTAARPRRRRARAGPGQPVRVGAPRISPFIIQGSECVVDRRLWVSF